MEYHYERMTFCLYNETSIYIIFNFCVFVCLTGYRLGLWRSHRLETDIIRTSMAWRGAIRGKFFRKVTSGEITEEKSNAVNAFLWENISDFRFYVQKTIIMRVFTFMW